MSGDILARIAASVRERLAAVPPAADLERNARRLAAGASRRGLRRTLDAPGVRIIAECKRRSPSAGLLRDPFDPVGLAAAYAAGGAAAISVVTEPEFFGGDPAWVAAVRRSVPLPVLRKDFVISPRQVFETVVLGADAVLLIVRLLDQGLLSDLIGLADDLGLDALVEAHDEAEIERAVDAGAVIVGVNARDLGTFSVDLDRGAALIGTLGTGRLGVLESGVTGAEDVRGLLRRGIRRLLVGEHLVRSADPRRAVGELVACG